MEKAPTRENKTLYNRLTGNVRYLTKKSKETNWRTTCSQLDLKKDGHKAWKLLQNLEGRNKKTNPQPLQDKKKNTVSSDKRKAKLLNDFFAQGTEETKTR